MIIDEKIETHRQLSRCCVYSPMINKLNKITNSNKITTIIPTILDGPSHGNMGMKPARKDSSVV